MTMSVSRPETGSPASGVPVPSAATRSVSSTGMPAARARSQKSAKLRRMMWSESADAPELDEFAGLATAMLGQDSAGEPRP
jgi:hypothetical protein